MKNITIEHIEQYNKEFNISTFNKSLVKGIDIERDGIDAFYKTCIEATIKSSPVLSKKKFDIAKLAKDQFMQENARSTYFLMTMVVLWLQYKQIYKFDQDTLEMVTASEFKDLTYDELKALKLPYDSFAIENTFKFETGSDRDGIFDTVLVNKQVIGETGNVLLAVYPFYKDTNNTKTVRYDIILEKYIENDSILKWIERTRDEDDKDDGRVLKEIINLILYIAQPKVDVIKKKSEVKERKRADGDIPKSIYQVAYEENQVGLKLGRAIREHRQRIIYESEGKCGKGHTKTPHIRCGHFHHYWVGKGRTELTVKFVEPTFVLGGNKDVTLRKVGK